MIDLTEKQYVGMIRTPDNPGDTLVLDNGLYELKAGYKNSLCIVVRNRVYKNKERISFDPFPLASLKNMFDNDVIVNFDVLEHTIDIVLGHLKPDSLDKLIITATPYLPSEAEMLEFLFNVYKFNEIQIGLDFIYTYHQYFDKEDCLIVAMKYSSIIVAYVADQAIADIYKINFGGKEMIDYINFIMVDKYKEFRKDYKNLVEHMRVSDDYDREALEIYNEMCSGEYGKNIFLSEVAETKTEKTAKKYKKAAQQNMVMPSIDYKLLDADDSALDGPQIKEKKKQKMVYFGTMYRLKVKIERCLQTLGEIVENQEEELEKQSNLESYILKKKNRFNKLKRELELRDKLRKDARNRKTREFQIKNKEGLLDPEEQKIKDNIADAEDEERENILVDKIDKVSNEILKLDPEFIPFYANTVEILRGDNIGRQCANIELIKWPEIPFDPSIIESEQMGLVEIFENLCLKYDVRNVLLCGGFSFIKNLDKRIESVLGSMTNSTELKIIKSGNTQTDPFYGARFSPLCPTYTREEFEKYGAETLVEMNKKY